MIALKIRVVLAKHHRLLRGLKPVIMSDWGKMLSKAVPQVFWKREPCLLSTSPSMWQGSMVLERKLRNNL